ncbi:MAG: citrate transporter [Ignavibacteriae bacterium]|nr:citrate transporter [Ignavibacteriota bacterium]
MEIFQTILLISVFIVMALLMFLRVIPALIALPLMAILISLFGGVNYHDTIQYVIGEGSLKLFTAYTIAMFGSMLSVILQKTGVAESFIKRGAELAGDNPWIIGIIMLGLITMLFTTLGGLGAIIMVATIVLPIMASVGLGPMTTVGIFLLGLSIGGTLNVGNWAVYIDVMGLSVAEIRPFALVMFSISFIAAIIYLTIQLYRDGQDLNLKKISFISSSIIIFAAALFIIYFYVLSDNLKFYVDDTLSLIGTVIKYLIAMSIITLFIISISRAFQNKNEIDSEVHWTSYFSPLIPLFLILLFDIHFIAAFIIGLLYAFISTYKKGRLNLFIQSIFEGGGVVMPAVVLMFGIGMLLVAIMGPGVQLENYPNGWPVINLLKPLLTEIVPQSGFTYVLIFTALAPLALYRGPLNVWGMGYGLAAVFLASGLNPGAVMGLLLAVGQIQGISDPTNTHNVWLANEMRVDVQKVLWNTIPYTWVLAFLGLVFAALMFM